jgi:DNA-binding beta-propeller fold protein YncE
VIAYTLFMRNIYVLSSLVFFASVTIAQPNAPAAIPTQPSPSKEKVMLPNGWHLTPAGSSIELGDLPLNIVVSPSRKYIAVTNNGQSIQSIQLIDAKNDVVLDTKPIPKSWFGLKFSADEKSIYASGGNDNWIFRYAIEYD